MRVHFINSLFAFGVEILDYKIICAFKIYLVSICYCSSSKKAISLCLRLIFLLKSTVKVGEIITLLAF